MNSRRTVLFLAVLIVIAGFYYWKVHRPQATERIFSFSQDSKQAGVLALNPKEIVNRITLRDASKETEISFFKLNDQSWRITHPGDYPAESLIVNGFVTLLKLTKRARSLSFDSKPSVTS